MSAMHSADFETLEDTVIASSLEEPVLSDYPLTADPPIAPGSSVAGPELFPSDKASAQGLDDIVAHHRQWSETSSNFASLDGKASDHPSSVPREPKAMPREDAAAPLASRDAAAIGAPGFNRERNPPVRDFPAVSDWAAQLLSDAGDDGKVKADDAYEREIPDEPVNLRRRAILPDSERPSEEQTVHLRNVARTLGVTLGMELEVAGNGKIGKQDSALPSRYPDGLLTFFVKEVYVAGAAYESGQVQPGDFITALSSVPIEKVTIEFLSKKLRDFVGMAARQSVIDHNVQIPEIEGLPLHLGLLRLTGEELYPDNVLIFRSMLLKRLEAELASEPEQNTVQPLPAEPYTLAQLPGHRGGLVVTSRSQPLSARGPELEDTRVTEPTPEQARSPGTAASSQQQAHPRQAARLSLQASPPKPLPAPSTKYERRMVPAAASPVRSSPMGPGLSPHVVTPTWSDSTPPSVEIPPPFGSEGWRPPSTLTKAEWSLRRMGHGGVHSGSYTVPQVVEESPGPEELSQLARIVDDELEAAMQQLEASGLSSESDEEREEL